MGSLKDILSYMESKDAHNMNTLPKGIPSNTCILLSLGNFRLCASEEDIVDKPKGETAKSKAVLHVRDWMHRHLLDILHPTKIAKRSND